jgi:hypothetical protein
VFSAKVFDNIISKNDCDYLIDSAVYSDLWSTGGNEFWNNRVIGYDSMLGFDKKSAKIMYDANMSCRQIIKDSYGLENEVYSDTLQIIRWFPGMEQTPHADDMSNTSIPGFDHREFGSIIYLNENYSGGQTYYPNFDIYITPKAGSIAIHPGDVEHLHGVTKIEGETRYTIASFLTSRKEMSHEWQLPE